MYPLNDNDLDRLSRDAAEQYDVDQNVSTSGWEALETRLNKELPLKEEKERRRFLFWLFFIVLVAGGSLWWMLSGDNTDVAGSAHVASAPAIANDGKNNTPSAPAASPNTGIVQDDTKTIIDKKSVEQPQQPAQAPAEQATVDSRHNTVDQPKNNPQANPLPESKTAAGKEKEITTAASNKASVKNKSSKESYTDLLPVTATGKRKKKPTGLAVAGSNDYSNKANTNGPSRKKKGSEQLDIAGNKTTSPEAGSKDKLTTTDAQDQNDKQRVTTGETKDDAAKSQTIIPTVDTNKQADTTAVAKATPTPVTPQPLVKDSAAVIAKKPADKKNDKKVKGFEIGLTAGPDMSNVKFKHTSKAGYNAGLQLGYRFSDRWSVNTGLLYTKKNYKADGKDAAKYGWLQNPNVNVSAMEGYCSMFDIPLNVRYDFSVNQKRRYFVSTGLSTYIMKNEDYDYYWTYGSTTGSTNWNTDKANRGDSTYFFSILNISAGFERSLSRHLSIQAEPYLKLPLSQLGYAKLNLSSYGIYFSLKYRIAK